MKKIAVIISVCTLTLMLFGACKATKGCGLTSDATKIEQNLNTASEVVVKP